MPGFGWCMCSCHNTPRDHPHQPTCWVLLQVFLEDAGYDWKVLGPDVSDVDYVAWQADQDAYACSGQKCSAQSLMIMHSNWRKVCKLYACALGGYPCV
jgi:hypothetical protein